MDRTIVYPGSIPLDTDLLNTNRNVMVALGAIIRATLGTEPVVDGLAVVPTLPATLGFAVGPGSITQLGTIDQAAYGTLTASTAPLVKMGCNVAATSFSLATPTASGQSIAYLVEASFVEADSDPVVLPYYNSANPAQPWLGPSNSGSTQPTVRTQRVQLQVKPGVAAPTGSQVAPPVDAGWIGLATVNVAFGQAEVNAGHIVAWPSSSFVPYKLPTLRPGFGNIQVFTASGSFVVPSGVTRVKTTVIGGGGAGGTHGRLPGGGGGAGGTSIKFITGLTPGSVVPITVGGGGGAFGVPSNGGTGGTSSFGFYASATGGVGGGGGTLLTNCAGGIGGAGVGGDVNFGGSFGTDAVTVATRGGDGGGPGGGRGSTGLVNGFAGAAFGGGGGGGGCSDPSGSGTGAAGANGGSGVVYVEY